MPTLGKQSAMGSIWMRVHCCHFPRESFSNVYFGMQHLLPDCSLLTCIMPTGWIHFYAFLRTRDENEVAVYVPVMAGKDHSMSDTFLNTRTCFKAYNVTKRRDCLQILTQGRLYQVHIKCIVSVNNQNPSVFWAVQPIFGGGDFWCQNVAACKERTLK